MEIRKIKWTKNGWNKSSNTEIINKTVRSKIPYEQTNFDYSENDIRNPYIKLYNDAQQTIQSGCIFSEYSKFPQLLRQIVESNDWLIGSNNIYKKVDELDNIDGKFIDTKFAEKILEEVGIIEYDTLDHDTVSLNTNLYNVAENDVITEAIPKITLLEQLKKDTNDKVVKLTQEHKKQNFINKEDEINAIDLLEKKINSLIEPELTYSINSKSCGRGYISFSKDKYTPIYTDIENYMSLAKQTRENTFYNTFAKVASCTSYNELYGKVQPCMEYNEERDSYDVVNKRSGGEYKEIFEMYQHDKEIWEKFSTDEFLKQRSKAINTMRDKGKDEETIRKIIFKLYDRKSGSSPAQYDNNGKIIRESFKWPDSVWHRRQSRAFQNLNMTKAQWASLYKMIDIVKDRITRKETTPEEVEIIKKLQEDFNKIETLDDLQQYRLTAEKRKFNKNYDFEPSMIDKLSIVNHNRWWLKCCGKKKYLIQELVYNKQKK